MSTLKLQDPADGLDWAHDWSDFLASGDAIASRVWTMDPDDSPSLLSNTTTATVIVTGLSWGTVYRLEEKITTDNGVVGQRSLTIICGQA